MNLWLIFLTGLTTGGLSCLAMQGGLLASIIAKQKHTELSVATASGKHSLRQAGLFSGLDQLDWMPVSLFLATKLLAHIFLGFFLGWLGSLFAPSFELQLVFQVLTGLFMLVIALNLLDVHPFFRRFTLQPPKAVQRLVRAQSKNGALFAPAVMGALTVFIPCGVTQAMAVLAVSSGNPIQGALIMGAFVLGTLPLFAGIGILTAKLAEGWQDTFLRIAAYALILMAVYSLNGALVVLNSPVTVQKLVQPVTYFFSDERFSDAPTALVQDGVQQVLIAVSNHGYNPSYVKVKAGQPVQLTLATKETYSCAVAFRFPEFGISTFLNANDTQSFTFTPIKPGKYTYTCSMGMYTGVMEVI
jgi:sulfite exporter TauE/SafE